MNFSQTIDYFPELQRLCDSRTACEAGADNKEQCPLFDFCHQKQPACLGDIQMAIEISQNWNDEH